MVYVRTRRPGRFRPVDWVHIRGGCHHCCQRLPDSAGRKALPRSLAGAAHHCGSYCRGSHWLAYLEKPEQRQVVKEGSL